MIKNSSQFELHSDMLERKEERRKEEEKEIRKEDKRSRLTGLHVFSFYTHKFTSVG